MSILITGGAGFIGTHTAELLTRAGLDVVTLVTGRRDDLRWGSLCSAIWRNEALALDPPGARGDAVIQLAASAHVGESIGRIFTSQITYVHRTPHLASI